MNAVVDKIWVGKLKHQTCADEITKALLNMVGVLHVKPNLTEGWVEVEHEDFTDPESIEARLIEVIYEERNAALPMVLVEAEDIERPIQWML